MPGHAGKGCLVLGLVRGLITNKPTEPMKYLITRFPRPGDSQNGTAETCFTMAEAIRTARRFMNAPLERRLKWEGGAAPKGYLSIIAWHDPREDGAPFQTGGVQIAAEMRWQQLEDTRETMDAHLATE